MMRARFPALTRSRALILATLGTVGAATALAAQEPSTLRTVEFSRQRQDSTPLRVRVDYAAGKVVVHGTDQPLLYQAAIAYDPRRSEPVYDFDAGSRVLKVGTRQAADDAPSGPPGELRLDLARDVPVSLQLQTGASEADLDLGGMRLTRVVVESGATDASLHFDAPNRQPMAQLELAVGAASLQARGLANARASQMRVKVGVGSAELDFGGEWTNDVELELDVALGKAALRVPDDVGVRVETSRVLGSFEREGFVKRGDAYYSANWDRARHKLRVHSRMVLGELEITRGAS
ncbi:MAG TPA: hypothetical protein VFS08_18385 [Gemmatimonadaceae bacterium]|nr:hypothetical protein [Gemmatimonadaceae bacterium]